MIASVKSPSKRSRRRTNRLPAETVIIIITVPARCGSHVNILRQIKITVKRILITYHRKVVNGTQRNCPCGNVREIFPCFRNRHKRCHTEDNDNRKYHRPNSFCLFHFYTSKTNFIFILLLLNKINNLQNGFFYYVSRSKQRGNIIKYRCYAYAHIKK